MFNLSAIIRFTFIDNIFITIFYFIWLFKIN